MSKCIDEYGSVATWYVLAWCMLSVIFMAPHVEDVRVFSLTPVRDDAGVAPSVHQW